MNQKILYNRKQGYFSIKPIKNFKDRKYMKKYLEKMRKRSLFQLPLTSTNMVLITVELGRLGYAVSKDTNLFNATTITINKGKSKMTIIRTGVIESNIDDKKKFEKINNIILQTLSRDINLGTEIY